MSTHRQGKLLGSQSVCNGRSHFSDHVRGAWAHHLRSHNGIGICLKDQADKAVLLPGNDGFAVLSHIVNAAAHFHAKFSGLRLREANRSNLRLSIDAARHDRQRDKHAVWHCLQTDGMRLSRQIFNDVSCLRHSHMGQLCFCRNISNRIDSRFASFKVRIYHRPSMFDLQAHVLTKKTFRVRCSSNGYHHLIRFNLGRLIGQQMAHGTYQTFLPLDFLYHSIAVNSNALLDELFL